MPHKENTTLYLNMLNSHANVEETENSTCSGTNVELNRFPSNKYCPGRGTKQQQRRRRKKKPSKIRFGSQQFLKLRCKFICSYIHLHTTQMIYRILATNGHECDLTIIFIKRFGILSLGQCQPKLLFIIMYFVVVYCVSELYLFFLFFCFVRTLSGFPIIYTEWMRVRDHSLAITALLHFRLIVRLISNCSIGFRCKSISGSAHLCCPYELQGKTHQKLVDEQNNKHGWFNSLELLVSGLLGIGFTYVASDKTG